MTRTIRPADLRPGDVLTDGATVTSNPTRHPSGYVVAEVDWRHLRRWNTTGTVEIEEDDDAR